MRSLPLKDNRKQLSLYNATRKIAQLWCNALYIYIMQVRCFINHLNSYFGYREPTRFIGDSDVRENMEMVGAAIDIECASFSSNPIAAECTEIHT